MYSRKVFFMLFSVLSVVCMVPQNPGTIHYTKSTHYTKDHFGNLVKFNKKDVVVLVDDKVSLVVKFNKNFRVTFIPIWTRSIDDVE